LVDRARVALSGERLLAKGGGAAVVAELPWLAGVPVTALARIAMRCGLADVQPRISARRQAHLETAVSQLDRLYGPGAGVAELLDTIRDAADYPWAPGERPYSLGGIAVLMRRRARRCVKGDRRARRRRQSCEASS
jgi:hypothetical protein